MAEPSPADVAWIVELALARGWTTQAQVAAARAVVQAGRAPGLLPALAPLLRADHKEALRRELLDRTSERPTIPLGRALRLEPDEPGQTRADPGASEDAKDTGRLPQQATWPEPATTRAEGTPGESEDGRPTGRLSPSTAAEAGVTRADPREGEPAPQTGAGGWKPGARVGELVLGERLGEGGMGAVFLAEGQGGARRAVKVLAGGAEPTLVERFQREGQAQAATDGHPNVARVYGTGEAHGRRYLVLELIEGGDLDRRLNREGPWSSDRAARLGATLAVMFAADGTPKLVDFGIARIDKAQALTRTGVMLGTPAYGAPEQVGGDKGAIDERSDVYGLGAILFTVLTGAPPFEGDGLPALVKNVLMAPPPAPSSRAPGTDPELDELVVSALAKEPAARPPTARAMAVSLEAIAARLERGGPSTVGRRRRSRLPLAFGAAFAGGLGIVGLALGLRPGREGAAGVASVRTTTLALDLRADVAGDTTFTVVVKGPITGALDVQLDGASLSLEAGHYWISSATRGEHTLVATLTGAGARITKETRFRVWPAPPPGIELVGSDEHGAKYVHTNTGLRLRWVDPARFQMGKLAPKVWLDDPQMLTVGSEAVNTVGDEHRLRQHWVTIRRGYFIGETEVPRTLYDAWRDTSGRPRPDRLAPSAEGKGADVAELPVSGVTWADARAFCAAVGLMLPTEAEWELAARGEDGRLCPWADGGAPAERRVNFEFAFKDDEKRTNRFGVAPPDRFPLGTSPAGCVHMAGNVWEWVEDSYAPYPEDEQVDPLVGQGVGRVVRGGSYHHDISKCTAVWREPSDPDVPDLTIGFRVAWSPRERPPPVPTRPMPKEPEEEKKKRQ